ncbi:calcium-dependent phospholipase C [Porites harrisoni]
MGKVLIKGKKLPMTFEEDLDEGDVTEEDSADEMEDCFKFKNSENTVDQKAKERRWRRTLASLQRLRLNKDEEESDARGDLSSAIVTSAAMEQSEATEGSVGPKAAPRLQRSLSAKHSSRQGTELESSRKVKSFDDADKHIMKRSTKKTTWNNEQIARRTIKLSRQLSDLVAYTRSCAFKGLDLNEYETIWEVISVPESKAYRYTDTRGEEFVRYTMCKFCRIYPAGYRIDSSNPNPVTFWNCGCQLGESIFDPMTRKEIRGIQRKLCKIKVISGQQLPKPKDSILGDRGEIIDPYVEVELIGIPADSCKHRTKTVMDNGFNPVWEDTISFILTFPELAIVRFVVWDEDPIGRDFIGQVTYPFSSLMPGYRHVHLEGDQQASIYVHVTISDYSYKQIQESLEVSNPGRRYSGGVKFKKRIKRRDSSFI